MDPLEEPAAAARAGTTTKTLAVLALVLGIMSLIVMAVVFGPAAIVCGAIAGSRGSVMGWVGLGIGAFGLVAWVVLVMIADGQAL